MRSRDTAINRAARMINNQIGERIRDRRKHFGMSLSELAEKLDLSYQQLRNYEIGGTRVSAGRLWQIANILSVEPSYFFEGVEESAEYGDHGSVNQASMEVMQDFEKIQYPDVKVAVSGLLKEIAGGRKGRAF